MKNTFLLIILLFTSLLTTYAQEYKGTVMGSIRNDMSGDQVADAKVNIEIEGAIVKVGISDEKGDFRIYSINEGNYDIVVSAMGFAPLKITDVPVKALENTALELYFHGETFSQDTITMSYEEVSPSKKKSNSNKAPKEKKTATQKRLERAARKLKD